MAATTAPSWPRAAPPQPQGEHCGNQYLQSAQNGWTTGSGNSLTQDRGYDGNEQAQAQLGLLFSGWERPRCSAQEAAQAHIMEARWQADATSVEQLSGTAEQAAMHWENCSSSGLRAPVSCSSFTRHPSANHIAQGNSSWGGPVLIPAHVAEGNKARRNSWISANAPPVHVLAGHGRARRHSAVTSSEWIAANCAAANLMACTQGGDLINIPESQFGVSNVPSHTTGSMNSSVQIGPGNYCNNDWQLNECPVANGARQRRSSGATSGNDMYLPEHFAAAMGSRLRRNSAVATTGDYYGVASSLPPHLLPTNSKVRRNSTSVLLTSSSQFGTSGIPGNNMPQQHLLQPGWQQYAPSRGAAPVGSTAESQPPVKVRRLSDLEASLLYRQAGLPRATSFILPHTTDIDFINERILLASLSASATPAATACTPGMLGRHQTPLHAPSNLGPQSMHFHAPGSSNGDNLGAQLQHSQQGDMYTEPGQPMFWLDASAWDHLLWSEMLCAANHDLLCAAAAANGQMLQQATLQMANDLSSMSLQQQHLSDLQSDSHHLASAEYALQMQCQRAPTPPSAMSNGSCGQLGAGYPCGCIQCCSRNATGSGSGSSCQTPGEDRLQAKESNRPIGRLPSMFTDMTGPEALMMANRFMSRVKLPARVPYVEVQPNSILFQMGVICSFSAATICLASSYFQRLVEVMPNLESALRNQDMYREYTAGLPVAARAGSATPSDQSTDKVICCVQFTCLYIAAKVNELRSRHTKMLQAMLSQLAGSFISLSQANQVEVRCLEGLAWRLGPYYAQDDLFSGAGPEDMSPLDELA